MTIKAWNKLNLELKIKISANDVLDFLESLLYEETADIFIAHLDNTPEVYTIVSDWMKQRETEN